MTSSEIRRLQELLNKVGALLELDGINGRNTKDAIAEARIQAGLNPGNIADPELIAWLRTRPDPSPDLPVRGVTFIAKEEVGGRAYYERYSARPNWPGEESGITIGVGYDLRY